MPDGFDITTRHYGRGLHLQVSGELDVVTAPELQTQVMAAESANAAGPVILDFCGVTFIDSAGLRVVLEAHKRLGDQLRIVVSPATRRLFEIADVLDILPLSDT